MATSFVLANSLKVDWSERPRFENLITKILVRVLQKGSVTMRKIIGIDVSKSTAKLSVAIDAKNLSS
ncbi:hypothetical protein, partial [Lacticaseibacillus paracasei]|uniref:hypothetical protein n=1 Tax=Lacticaseibacillus paracasei TaxID=1597 RepID=UPI0027302459